MLQVARHVELVVAELQQQFSSDVEVGIEPSIGLGLQGDLRETQMFGEFRHRRLGNSFLDNGRQRRKVLVVHGQMVELPGLAAPFPLVFGGESVEVVFESNHEYSSTGFAENCSLEQIGGDVAFVFGGSVINRSSRTSLFSTLIDRSLLCW